MKLAEYLKQNDLTQKDFAEKIGVTQSAISQIIKGLSKPSAVTAWSIQEHTRGEVRARELRPDLAQIFGERGE